MYPAHSDGSLVLIVFFLEGGGMYNSHCDPLHFLQIQRVKSKSQGRSLLAVEREVMFVDAYDMAKGLGV